MLHTLEFRLDGTQINVENNTEQRHILIEQEDKGGNITPAVKLKTLISYFIRWTAHQDVNKRLHFPRLVLSRLSEVYCSNEREQ